MQIQLMFSIGFMPMQSVDFFSTGKNNEKPVVPGSEYNRI